MHHKTHTTILLLVVAMFAMSCRQSTSTKDNSSTPKNVILLIGDGMGIQQVYSLISLRDKHQSSSTRDKTAFEQFRHIGFSKTQSADSNTTDSAAGGTALATGHRTNNGWISLHPETKQSLETLVEWGNKKGLSTGIVAACAITHATPASFLAHNIDRDNSEEIAFDIIRTQPTIFIGGGRIFFEERKDGLNLSDSLRNKGYSVIYNMQELENAQGKIAGLMYGEHPESALEGRGDYLSTATMRTIANLNKNKTGFFLMVEASQIDWAGHDNDYPRLIAEMEDFDKVLHKVLDFARKDGNTLVVVTADHETGGLIIIDNENKHIYNTTGHTPIMVPVYAFGPGAEEFGGIYNNTEVHDKIIRLLDK